MLKKLIYRSTYRGSREMDYLLSKFADSELSNLDNQEVVSYASLLDQEDPYIYDWIMSKAQVPLEFTHIIDRIKNFHSKV